MTYEGSPETGGENPRPSSPGFFSRLLRTLFRLLLAVVAGAVLGGAIYFGARSFYRQAVVIPAQESISRMEDLSTRQARQATQAAGEIARLNERLNQLEKGSQADAEDISSLEAEITSLNKQLEQSQATLSRLGSLENNLSAIATQSMGNRQEIESMLSSTDGPVTELRREIQMLQAMELLNRCRLYLSQNNYGLAEQDARLVRQIFIDLQAESAPADQATLDLWISRLDLALTNLDIAPVLAGEDLEMVWRMVLAGLPQQQPVSSTPGESTPVPTRTPWFTPTPSPTPFTTPTSTSAVTPTPAAT